MKKLLVVLAAAGLLFAMSSCTKNCTCKVYSEDAVVSEEEIEVGGSSTWKNCDDLQKYYEDACVAYDATLKAGVKCE